MSDWMPSLNALRAFEAVARHLSYSAAAAELMVTPGAVKHLVSKLELSVGGKLVERRGHGLELTPMGLAGKNELTLGIQNFSSAVRQMRSYHSNRRLIVSVEASLATTWLSTRLTAFLANNPDIDVLVDASQKVFDLKRSDVDVAVRYGVERDEDLVSDRLFEDLVFPACSPALALGPPALEAPQQIGVMPLIHWDTSHMSWASATRRWFSWESWAQASGVKDFDASRGKRFSDYGLAVQAAVSGQGVILAGWPALMDTIQEGLLVCPFKDSVVETDIGFDLVTTRHARQRPEVKSFCDWLLKIASEVSTTGFAALDANPR